MPDLDRIESLCNIIRGASLMTPEPHRKAVFAALDELESFILHPEDADE